MAGTTQGMMGHYPAGEARIGAGAVVGTTILPMRRPISWGAIIGGVALVMAIQFLLATLGLGVGLATLDSAQGNEANPSGSNLGIGAGAWWTISYVLSLVAGGFVAARLAGLVRGMDGILHGLLTWSVALILSFYLLSTAVGSLVGGAIRTVGSAVSMVGSAATQAVGAAAPEIGRAVGLNPDQITERARELLNAQPAGGDPRTLSPEQAQKEVAANLPKLVTGGAEADQARDRIVAVMAAQMNISEDEARNRLGQLQSQIDQSKAQVTDTARQTAQSAAKGTSAVSFLTFAALLLGAIAAALGGRWGIRGNLDDLVR